MSTVDDPGLFASPTRPLRRLSFWTVLVALLLSLLGLLMVALTGPFSGPVVWMLSADHSLHLADVMGAALLAAGSALTWIVGLIWQWQQTH